ncbi:MAG: GntR family transcriptional regulator [Lentisphaeria bacterium]|nr:GntR family transcriptional regulator [Lentisphaeria bacterium]
MRKTKSYKLESILERRIGMGDYALLDFPAERKLAAAFNVTQMTARKAVKNLEKRGLLERQPNGTVTAARVHGGTAVFLAPAFLSSHVFMFQRMLAAAAGEAGWQLRTVLYTHWDDACIEESLERFDGAFLYPVREEMSERLTELLRETETPVVALGVDMSGLGIPSFLDRPANAAELMVDFLKNQGYRKIDFLLTQPRGMGSSQWLSEWRRRLTRHELTGEFFEYPVESYGDSFEQAYRCVGALIERGAFNSACLLGATMAEAVGACRALASHGIVPGRDISVSAVAGSRGGAAEYFIPSITAVVSGDCREALVLYFEWMAQSGSRWPGEMVRWGEGGHVFAGESVIPAERLRGCGGKAELFREAGK